MRAWVLVAIAVLHLVSSAACATAPASYCGRPGALCPRPEAPPAPADPQKLPRVQGDQDPIEAALKGVVR